MRRRALLQVRSHQARIEARAAELVEGDNAPTDIPASEASPVRQPDLDREKLAKQYEKLFDKPPHARMKTETIAARIAEHADTK